MAYNRKEIDRPVPNEVFSAQLNLRVFFKEQKEPDGFRKKPLLDNSGSSAFSNDGRNHTYFADGETVPDGFKAVTVDDTTKPKFKNRRKHELAPFTVREKGSNGEDIDEISVSESDIPKPLRDAFRDAGLAILADIVANKPE